MLLISWSKDCFAYKCFFIISSWHSHEIQSTKTFSLVIVTTCALGISFSFLLYMYYFFFQKTKISYKNFKTLLQIIHLNIFHYLNMFLSSNCTRTLNLSIFDKNLICILPFLLFFRFTALGELLDDKLVCSCNSLHFLNKKNTFFINKYNQNTAFLILHSFFLIIHQYNDAESPWNFYMLISPFSTIHNYKQK